MQENHINLVIANLKKEVQLQEKELSDDLSREYKCGAQIRQMAKNAAKDTRTDAQEND